MAPPSPELCERGRRLKFRRAASPPLRKVAPTTKNCSRLEQSPKRHVPPRGAFLYRRAIGIACAQAPSHPAQNGRDRVDGNPIDFGNLERLHSVLHQSPDARKLRPRDLRRYLLRGADRCFDFLVTDRRRRRGCQHAWFARRLLGPWGVRSQLLGDLQFRREQRLRRLTRSRDPLAVISARVRVLPSAKQDLLRRVDPFATSKRA